MNVVVVNESLPYPPTAGNRIRTLNLMLKLAKRHQLTYLCRGGESEESCRQAVEFLGDHGIETIVAEGVIPRRQGADLYLHALANMASPLPYAVAGHRSRSVQQAILRQAQSKRIDLWQFEWLAYADALSGIAGARRLVIAHNVESLIWERYVRNEPNFIKRAYLWSQWRKFRRFERRVLREVDGVICVSAADEALARAEFKIGHTAVVDNGVDCDRFAELPRQPEPATVLFLGSLDWRPNQDAVQVLLENIFPALQALAPQVRLQIVGRNPPAWLQQRVASLRGVEVIADVPDVRPYLAKATVMTVPLRIGGGSRLKILEAMAAGTPVVSTAVGCEGLAVGDGVHLRVGDDPAHQAELLLDAIRHPAKTVLLCEAARHLVRESYDWEALAQRLEAVWQELVRYRLPPLSAWQGTVPDTKLAGPLIAARTVQNV